MMSTAGTRRRSTDAFFAEVPLEALHHEGV